MTKRQALLIGVAEYESSEIDNLPVVFDDIELLKSSLEDSGFKVSTLGVRGEAQPTRSRILQNLRQACRGAKGVETLLLYLSGHGLHYNGQNYVVPTDAIVNDPELDDYLVSTELGSVLDECQAKTIVLVVDACREGFKLKSKNLKVGRWGTVEKRLASKRNVAIVFSCAPGQKSYFVDADSHRGGSFSVTTP